MVCVIASQVLSQDLYTHIPISIQNHLSIYLSIKCGAQETRQSGGRKYEIDGNKGKRKMLSGRSGLRKNEDEADKNGEGDDGEGK